MKALILVDLQNDFMPGGALPVPEGDRVVLLANHLAGRFDLVLAAQVWHPLDHASFAINHAGGKPGDVIDLNGLPQVLWPVHCVQGTPGAAFHRDFDTHRVARVFRQGTDPAIDSHSAFFDRNRLRATGLGDYLKARGVTEVYLAGLVTDYCIKYSVMDALGLGLRPCVIQDACRGVNLIPGDDARAFEEMRSAGARLLTSHQLGLPMAA